MKIVLDLETNSLRNYTTIHCAVAIDIETQKQYVFLNSEINTLPRFLEGCDLIIGHNICDFDYDVLVDLLDYRIKPERILDTLILCRLLNFNIEGGNSLEAWGDRLGIKKTGLDVSFEAFSQELLDRCISDCKINVALYKYLMQPTKVGRGEFKDAIDVEHKMAFICKEMKHNGFAFDLDKAKEIYSEVETKIKILDEHILQAFPPKSQFVREVTPKATKFGTINRSDFRWYKGEDLSIFCVGCPFSVVTFESFNPGSTSQVVQRLNDAGWKPTSKTKGHIEAERSGDTERLKKFQISGWKVDEENLSTLPDTAPEGAKKLVERLLLASRLRTLDEWRASYNPATGRIHGTILSLGTYTHRATHKAPNTGNVAAEKSIKYRGRYLKDLATSLGGRMRSLWIAPRGKVLVGTDAEGIQLRIFAHYINDDRFTKAVTTGNKDHGTDPHSLNGSVLSTTRDNAKTFIFAFLLGAGDGKIAEILGRTFSEGRQAKKEFTEAYPGLALLKRKIIPSEATRGYTRAIDGRYIACSDAHLMMAVYLQSGEALVMKYAIVDAYTKLKNEGIEFKIVNWVHDEVIYECDPKDAEYIGLIQRNAIRDAGIKLNLKCPMSGETKIGTNWLQAH